MEFLETSLNDFDILVVTETHLANQINDSDITQEKADIKERASEVSSKYVQISISPNSKRSTQFASVRMEHAYSR
jgi:hypothetical protein